MAFVYITDLCRNKLQKKKDYLLIKRINSRIELLRRRDDPEELIEDYRYSGLFKDRIGAYRLLIQRIGDFQNTDHTIYALRDFNHVNDADKEIDYSPTEWLKSNPLSSHELDNIAIQFDKDYQNWLSHSFLPELPNNLLDWTLPNYTFSDTSIYETAEWVQSMESINARKQRQFLELKDCLESLLNAEFTAPNKLKPIFEDKVYFFTQRKVSILFRKIRIDSENDIESGLEVYLLIKAFYDVDPNKDKLLKLIKSNGYHHKFTCKDDLIKKARRAYPSYMVIEPETWEKVQFDKTSNLALSVEEEEILDNTKYPVFINGQAGSGKSTMLQYLFAQYSHKAIKEAAQYRPIYLTYSDRLVEQAKENVLAILNNHSLYSEEKQVDSQKINGFFASFERFIIDRCLGESESLNFLLSSKKITFAKFKLFYTGIDVYEFNEVDNLDKIKFNNHKIRKKYSPELVWHVIRSYIKGFSSESLLDQKKFKQLKGKDAENKTVSDLTFHEVYEYIWKPWYSNILQKKFQMWDDQDLVRSALCSKNFEKSDRHIVVFCDESQDFTRVELEFILKLSVFAGYNLRNVMNLPFAFAGDPYQTINPTGFSWESLRAVVHQKFADLGIPNLNLNIEHLKQNYRSSEEIIKFANLVQFWRHYYLYENDLIPQQSWFSYKNLSNGGVRLYILEKNISPQKIKSIVEESLINNDQSGTGINTIVLTPEELDDKQLYDFVKSDPILDKIVLKNTKAGTVFNLLGTFQAKGLEFPKIILYNFGDYFCTSLKDSVENLFKNESLSESKYLQLSYFFNRLYVAITRAQDFLFIVDSQKGYNKFWKYFSEGENTAALVKEDPDWSINDIGILKLGDNDFLQHIIETDAYKIALEMEQKGELDKNPSLLRNAMTFYEAKAELVKVYECRIKIAIIHRNWKEAGIQSRLLWEEKDKEEDIHLENAARFFWRGGNWSELIDIYEDFSKDSILRKVRVLAAHFMMNKREEIDVIQLLEDSNVLDHFERLDETWIKISDRIYERLQLKIQNWGDSFEKKIDSASIRQIEKYADKGIKKLYKPVALLYFLDNNNRSAVHCWEKITNNDARYPDEYFTAKGKLAVTSEERVFYFSQREGVNEDIKLSYDKQLIQLYEENEPNIDYKTAILNFRDNAVSIFSTYLRLGKLEAALKIPLKNLDEKIGMFYDHTSKRNLIINPNIQKTSLQNILAGSQPQVLIDYLDRFSSLLLQDEEVLVFVFNFIFKQNDWQHWYKKSISVLQNIIKESDSFHQAIVQSIIRTIERFGKYELILECILNLERIIEYEVQLYFTEILLNVLAQSEIEPRHLQNDFSITQSKKIHDYIKESYDNDRQLSKVTLAEWGSIFERLNISYRDYNAQIIYSRIINSKNITNQEKTDAKYRWLIEQERKLIFTDQANAKRSIQKEFEVQLLRWRLSEDKFRFIKEREPYPKLAQWSKYGRLKISGLDASNEIAYNDEKSIVTINLFDLEVRIIAKAKRINITEMNTGFSRFIFMDRTHKNYKESRSFPMEDHHILIEIKDDIAYLKIRKEFGQFSKEEEFRFMFID